MMENFKRDLETEKRVYNLMDRAFEYMGITISRNKYPQIYVGNLGDRGGRYNLTKNQVYLNHGEEYSGSTIGEEAIGHFVRDNLPWNKLKSFLRRTKRKVLKKDSYNFEDKYVSEFFGYLGRRILKEVATSKDKLLFDDGFSSNKVVVKSLKAYNKERMALRGFLEENLPLEEKEAKGNRILQLYRLRLEDLTHARPYHFASQVDLNKLDLPKLYRMSNKEVRRRFFRERPIYENSLEQKVKGATAIIGLLGSIFFLSSNFTGQAISNLSLKNSNVTGAILFLIGIIGALCYFRRKQ